MKENRFDPLLNNNANNNSVLIFIIVVVVMFCALSLMYLVRVDRTTKQPVITIKHNSEAASINISKKEVVYTPADSAVDQTSFQPVKKLRPLDSF